MPNTSGSFGWESFAITPVQFYYKDDRSAVEQAVSEHLEPLEFVAAVVSR